MHGTEEGQQMVFTKAVELHPAHQDHTVVVTGEEGLVEQLSGIHPVP